MSAIKEEDNEFKKQIKKIEEIQQKSENPEHFNQSSKVPATQNVLRKHPLVLIILGALGLIYTGMALIGAYKSTSMVSELVKPLIYNFIPFVISFFLCKIGIDGLNKRKK